MVTLTSAYLRLALYSVSCQGRLKYDVLGPFSYAALLSRTPDEDGL